MKTLAIILVALAGIVLARPYVLALVESVKTVSETLKR